MMSLHVTRLMNLVVSHSVDPGRAAVRWTLGRERTVKRMTNNLHCFIFRWAVTVYDFDLNILKLLLQGFIYEYRNINEILHQPRLWHCGCVWWRLERWGQTSRAASFVRQGRMGRATRTRTETLKLKWNQKWKLNTLLICLFALDNECKSQQ